MHTAEDKFVCHTFTCEPSSGALCKTIEAACKVSVCLVKRQQHDCRFVSIIHIYRLQLRYQKCLDAHPENRLSSESSTPTKGIGATIKILMNTFTLKKDKATSWERAKSLQVRFKDTWKLNTSIARYWPQFKQYIFFILYLFFPLQISVNLK